ncbi:type II CAAX prenyl endopeptidase Rce1 family protein [Bordetella hinzii]|jgi:membrane protease YdiL (CAAX protease family)|uniref:CPBP family intramembrane metalloprotease n=2 Tax=Bordetella hinzii TaxID=103855 RepID=A0AAN1RUU0_9BORD|nr:CPBP family glutamic-type intramembrane protease [Bordetella hinzii]AKQ54097.1 CAAX amino terminal protease self- immunity [Bordetella hinzii]AKQ58587.1 CAAX amino terminal protease self- immunity [Bordetella hinzii]AZW16110.1 CPBP family intramembrane metalloprotease [Bordetella hinzii]KCB25940.1 CAAX protease self-immunity [Bordetella hinzii OH87 BAL007II]KCB26787.1 CAAX protease self-immunity [Bordetella hinzii L60]
MTRPTLRQEVADWWRFLRRPTLAGRLGPRQGGAMADWRLNIRPGRLLAWAGLLWLINLVVLGPIAVGAATLGGAQHRMDPDNIPWLTAVIWAPLVEELLFRYGLRRPVQALWVVPAILPAVLWGPKFWTGCITAAVILLAIHGTRRMAGFKRAPRRFYHRHFGLVFHLAALTFAAVHLSNFSFNRMPWWMLPLLVLPQWLTGLVLGWMRVRRGIAASIALHALFNAGPMVMIWLLLKLVPDMTL